MDPGCNLDPRDGVDGWYPGFHVVIGFAQVLVSPRPMIVPSSVMDVCVKLGENPGPAMHVEVFGT